MTESSATENAHEKQTTPKTTYPEGNWKRKTSYGMGEYLKMDDEMMTINRGGKRIKMVKNVAFHVPIIPFGELDEYGKELLDAMLEGKRDPINDIVEFFKNYEPQPGLTFNKKSFKEAQQAEVDKEKEEEMKLMKEKMINMMSRANENNKKDKNEYILNLDDPDFKKIPFMHPDTKKHTFEEWFEILYSVCDPKGLTDDQCVDVMEILVGGSYITELKDMKAKHNSLNKIEKHFLKKDIINNPGYIFEKDDPDFQKIPFMHPDKKENTFGEHFDKLYSVCDPKGLTDDQCTDVMEIRMGGEYLDELKEFKSQNSDLDTIELHFLSKDKQGDGKDKKKELLKSSKVKGFVYEPYKKRHRQDDDEYSVDKSNYRHITGIYKPYRPELLKTLRSDSVERHQPTDKFIHSTYVSASSFYSPPSFSLAVTPFTTRAMSAPWDEHFSYQRGSHNSYSDSKVTSLVRQDTAQRHVAQNRDKRSAISQLSPDRFSSRYNYYDGNKYPITNDVLGRWKHYNIYCDTLNYKKGRSPTVTMNRYPGPELSSYLQTYSLLNYY